MSPEHRVVPTDAEGGTTTCSKIWTTGRQRSKFSLKLQVEPYFLLSRTRREVFHSFVFHLSKLRNDGGVVLELLPTQLHI